MLIAAQRLIDGAGHDALGWLRTDSGLVVQRGSGPPPSPAPHTLDVVVPGFIDSHVHGALGVDFGTCDADPLPAIEHHARSGSTTLVASLATAPLGATVTRLRELAHVVQDGHLAGVHLEGPWLSPGHRGAHDPRFLRTPSRHDLDLLLAAGDGTVCMVTIAPELPGAIGIVAELVAAGVTVAIGHTDADADQVRRAVQAGASVITHLFNGMRPLHHRQPGPVGVALSDGRLHVEIIADGRHVSDEVVDLVRRMSRGRLCLVSDAMAATGLGDGSYSLGAASVVVHDGVAELADRSSLAGSTHPLGETVARLLGRGVPAPELVSMTSVIPAQTLGSSQHSLQVGDPADLVELTGAGPQRVMRRGTWLPSSS